jgi:hypothetical protein
MDQDAGRILVNVPDARSVAVIDEASAKQVATWPMDKSGNFAMAMDHAQGRVLLAFRSPPELAVIRSQMENAWQPSKPAAISTISSSIKSVTVFMSAAAPASSMCSRATASATAA